MTALLRYVAADAVGSQRWVAPMLCFLVALTVLDAGGGSALSCYGSTSAAMLAVAIWLAIAIAGSEDPIQTAVTVVTVGSSARVRLAKLAAAYVACLPMILVAVVWPLVAGGHTATFGDVMAGLVAHLLTALAGVGFGALLSRPVLRHTAWAVLLGVAIFLAEVAIPDVPPARQLLTLFGADHPHGLAMPIVIIALEAVGLAVITVFGAHRIARTRG